MTATARTAWGRHRALPPRRADPYGSTVASCPWCGGWFRTYDASPGVRFCDRDCLANYVHSRCAEAA